MKIQGQEDIESPGFGQIWNLLDILQILGDQGRLANGFIVKTNIIPEQCEPILVWYLIEELLESQSIEGCRVVFDYLESRRERLAVGSCHPLRLELTQSVRNTLRKFSSLYCDHAMTCCADCLEQTTLSSVEGFSSLFFNVFLWATKVP